MRTLLVLRPWRIRGSSMEIRRSRATPCRSCTTPPGPATVSCTWTCRAAASPVATWESSAPPSSAASPSTRPTAASTTPSACCNAAGSSQSRSNAAFRLDAASSGTPPRAPPQPPPLPTRQPAHDLAQRVAQQAHGVLYPARPPQRAGVKRRPQLATSDPTGHPPIQRQRALHQPPIQIVGDQPRAEADQRRLRKRRLGVVHAVQYQLPAPIHHRRLQHLVIGGAGIGL